MSLSNIEDQLTPILDSSVSGGGKSKAGSITANTDDDSVQKFHGSVLLNTPKSIDIEEIYTTLDYRLIPALWTLYFLTSFGSAAYGVSLTMNSSTKHSLKDSLHLTPHDLSLATSLDFVAFILLDVPMNIIMTQQSPQIWLSRIVISIGLVNCSYIFLKSSTGLIILRTVYGICGAGTWPGMSYYISLWYPHHRSAKRVGYYFTAALLSSSSAGLISAAFQKMDMVWGLTGWKWMFLVHGTITTIVGFLILYWLPDRPIYESHEETLLLDASVPEISHDHSNSIFRRFFENPLTNRELNIHKLDMDADSSIETLQLQHVWNVFGDVRIWPLIIMYFGVVGTGFGLAIFGSTIISVINPNISSVWVSLLYAPIWICDLIGVLFVTPLADKYTGNRSYIFSIGTLIMIIGILTTTFASGPWWKYSGLLITGFGLGPTIPICMVLTVEIFRPLYGEVGVAVSTALVSGLGNCGSAFVTYNLFGAWEEDEPRMYKYSNMTLVLMLVCSTAASRWCDSFKVQPNNVM